MACNPDNLIWIDLEMTGLNPEKDQIIEIATIITDSQLNIIAEGPVYAIFQHQSILDTMDEWNTRQHGQSGLLDRVKLSAISESIAEEKTLDFVKQYLPAQTSPMCGNSICQDRRFLARHMPQLESFFHYRNLDVSSLKELAHRWAPNIMQGFAKKSVHLALDDIRESIMELEYYRKNLLKIER